jgi:radical SAM protein with 4Fe4S-binding SPASM domain
MPAMAQGDFRSSNWMQGDIDIIASPYLQVIDREELSAVCDVAASQGLELHPYLDDGTLGVVLDHLDHRFIVLSTNDIGLLDSIQRNPSSIGNLTAPTYGRLLAARALVRADEIVRRHNFNSIEIEINRHCNIRCEFCPVATAPKPKGFMADELYQLTLDRVVEYGAKEISLTHYGEPTMDPNLIKRISQAADRGLSVRLHTNATLFNEDKVRELAMLGNTRLIVNLPSADKAEYERINKSKLFDRVVGNLELMHEHGVPTQLSINSPRHATDAVVRAVNERFAAMFGDSVSWPSDSRAGLVDNAYVQPVSHASSLNGCLMQLSQLCVSHEGKVFVCSNDFDQKNIMGDLTRQSIREIAEGDPFVTYRSQLLGITKPADNFICARCEWTQERRAETPLSFGSSYKRRMFQYARWQRAPRNGHGVPRLPVVVARETSEHPSRS